MSYKKDVEYIGGYLKGDTKVFILLDTKTNKIFEESKSNAPLIMSNTTNTQSFAGACISTNVITKHLIEAILSNRPSEIDRKVLQLKNAHDNMIKYLKKENSDSTEHDINSKIKEDFLEILKSNLESQGLSMQEFSETVLKVERINNTPLFKEALEEATEGEKE